MFEHRTAFIDEYGNENLKIEVKDVSSYFIITAVIVEDEGLEILEPSVESIRKVHFQTGEMKSSTVGNSHARRSRVIDSLVSTGLNYATLIVDKSEINKESGLRYKKSFRKFLSNLLYNRLYKTFPNLIIKCDKHGGKSFMNSFKKYVEIHKRESLFEKQEFEFVDSKDSVLVQAADFISGTWAKILDSKIEADIRNVWKSKISGAAVLIDFWPPSMQSLVAKTGNDSYLNNLVRQQCYQFVQQYISSNQFTGSLNEEEAAEMEARLAALRFLLYENEIIENNQFVYSQTIIAYLKKMNYGEFTKRKLASSIISPLRDSGVIISSSNMGYRIPTTVEDIVEFARTTGDKVIPMLVRLGRARDQILLASDNRLNIIDESGHSILNRFVDELKESQIQPLE